MKAIIYNKYGPPEVLQVNQVDAPVPKQGEILIKIKATSITAGDTELRSPKIPSLIWFIVRLFLGFFKPRFKILGSYIAGEVVEVGSKVSNFHNGDSVFGISASSFGGYAEFVALKATEALVSKPEKVSYTEAAPLGLGLDSLHFLRKAKVKANEKVLINGAGGGIGTYAIQIAKYWGAEVTAVDSQEKLQLLRDVGADKVIDYTQEEVLIGQETYDVIFDIVGVLPKIKSLKSLNKKGRYISAMPSLSYLFWGVWASITSTKKLMTGLTSPTTADLEYLAKLLEAGDLKSIIDREYSMEQIVEAHTYIESGAKKGNSVLLMID